MRPTFISTFDQSFYGVLHEAWTCHNAKELRGELATCNYMIILTLDRMPYASFAQVRRNHDRLKVCYLGRPSLTGMAWVG